MTSAELQAEYDRLGIELIPRPCQDSRGYLNWRRYYLAYRGLCRFCGAAQRRTGQVLCESCWRRVRSILERKRSLGTCITCSAPAAPGRVRCAKHLGDGKAGSRAFSASHPGYFAENSRRLRGRRKSLGLCISCGTPALGMLRCGRCRAKCNAAYKRWYDRKKESS